MLKIREIRKARGLTMKQLGDMVGALESSISFYERGVQQPDLDMLRKIADALCVSSALQSGRSYHRLLACIFAIKKPLGEEAQRQFSGNFLEIRTS